MEDFSSCSHVKDLADSTVIFCPCGQCGDIASTTAHGRHVEDYLPNSAHGFFFISSSCSTNSPISGSTQWMRGDLSKSQTNVERNEYGCHEWEWTNSAFITSYFMLSSMLIGEETEDKVTSAVLVSWLFWIQFKGPDWQRKFRVSSSSGSHVSYSEEANSIICWDFYLSFGFSFRRNSIYKSNNKLNRVLGSQRNTISKMNISRCKWQENQSQQKNERFLSM